MEHEELERISARWPAEAPPQAAWVRARIDEGYSFEEILAALARGEFKAPPLP
jgi:hypothetical protein